MSPRKTTGVFSPQLFEFLIDLTGNNDREWFNSNKPRYEEFVREPARAFIRAMATPLSKISRHLTADDRKLGGSLMRVYRDTRFSKDKTPYKTNVGIQFRHAAGKDVHAPGLYVHIALDSTFLGAGVWAPDGPALEKIRGKIDSEPKRWRRIMADDAFASLFEPRGSSLKRPPSGFAKDHPVNRLGTKAPSFRGKPRLAGGHPFGFLLRSHCRS